MPESPYLAFRAPRSIPPHDGPGRPVPPNFSGPSRGAQWTRLGPRLTQLEQALEARTLAMTATAPGVAAEDVLVFEIAGTYEKFFEAVRATEGMEWLAEAEDEFDAGVEEFVDRGDSTKEVKGVIYMVASNASALRELKSAWNRKAAGQPLQGAASKFGQLLDHVIEVRAWGWQDRLAESGIEDWREELELGAERIRFEAELWFREDRERRARERATFEAAVVSYPGLTKNL